MRNIRFIKEPGYFFDLFFLFTLHFNKEYCLANFINYDKPNDDTVYFEKLLNSIPDISDELLVFFRISEGKNNFISQYCFESHWDKFVSGEYGLSYLHKEFTDHEKIVSDVLKFYFKDADNTELEACRDSIFAANSMIKGSNYSDSVKTALYSFIISPAPVIEKLLNELTEKELVLSQAYEKNSRKLSCLRKDFNFELLSGKLKQIKSTKLDVDDFNNIDVSFSLLNKNYIMTHYTKDTAVVLLGADYIDYIDYMSAQKNMPDLDAFGHAVSETNRVKILRFMHKRGEITIKDIEQKFKFTGTNSYYHLALMIKAGMLKTRTRGRTVLYSINKEYFRELCNMLSEYYLDN